MNQSRFRPVKHLKKTVWTSVGQKILKSIIVIYFASEYISIFCLSTPYHRIFFVPTYLLFFPVMFLLTIFSFVLVMGFSLLPTYLIFPALTSNTITNFSLNYMFVQKTTLEIVSLYCSSVMLCTPLTMTNFGKSRPKSI